MGLEVSQKQTYLKISGGKIRQRVEPGTDGAVVRRGIVNGKEFEVYELCYDSASGYITDIRLNEHPEYGNSVSVTLQDGDDKFTVQMGENSRYAQTFIQYLPSVDFSKPVEIKPYSIKNGEYNNIGVVIKQEGEKLPNHYKTFNVKTGKNKLKNGMEKFDFTKCEDTDERNILKIKLIKFLRQELLSQIERLENEKPDTPNVDSEVAPDDDLHF